MKKLKRLAAFLMAVCVVVSALGCGPSGTKDARKTTLILPTKSRTGTQITPVSP